MQKVKKTVVLAKPVTPKKIAAAASCCKTGPARTTTTDGKDK